MTAYFSRRCSSRSTASRMKAASLFGPSNASMRAIVSAGRRMVVGLTPSEGRPIRGRLSATTFSAKAILFPQPLIDGVSATAYVSAIGYGGKSMNHYPLIGRKVPSSCNDASGTANPFAQITCPACQSRLAKKVALEDAEATKLGDTQEGRFHAATADMFVRVLEQRGVPA